MQTVLNGKTLEFNPSDWDGMLKLMDRADEFKEPFFGENEEGEKVMISVNKDNITTSTFQSNKWTRENIYHRDFTTEELFHK